MYSLSKYFILALLVHSTANADVANSVGNGVTEVVHGVGKGVSDLGTGVGNAVTDVGTGIGNAFEGKKSVHYSDSDITRNIRNSIKELTKNNKIDAKDELDVRTSKGAVTISGSVIKEADISTIKDAATKTAGVTNVTMNVVVAGN